MKHVLTTLSLALLVACNHTGEPPSPPPAPELFRDGEMRGVGTTDAQIWSGNSRSWLSVEAFWLEFAETRGGLTWGRGSEYPEYEKVNEYDTFMVETGKGICLMEFFHGRWRRAQDVRRWNEALNDYAGCPHVFD